MNLNLDRTLANLLVTTFLFFAIGMTALFIGKGFDLTDESYYLIWARQPHNNAGFISNFGHITQWLYSLGGDNIVRFRQLGALLLLLAACLFSFFFTKVLSNIYGGSTDRWATAFLLIGTSLTYYFHRWFPTPSYNWLSLISCLVVGAGLLWYLLLSLKEDRSRNIWLASFFVGVGGLLAFLAKPTTALLLGTIAIWWVGIHWHKAKSTKFLIGALFVFILLLAIFIQFEIGGPTSYFHKFLLGVELISVMQGGYTISEMTRGAVQDISRSLIWGTVATVFFLLLSRLMFYRRSASSGSTRLLISMLFTVVALEVTALLVLLMNPEKLPAAVFFGFLVALVLTNIFCSRQLRDNFVTDCDEAPGNYHGGKYLAIVSICVLLNFAYGFGTQVGFFLLNSSALILLVAACVLLTKQLDAMLGSNKFTLSVSIFTIIATMIFVLPEVNQPYRLRGPLYKQINLVHLFEDHDSLKVDKATTRYISNLVELAADNGWKRGTPLLDLTGITPGALAILDAKVLGVAWFLGGQKGSNDFVKLALQSVNKHDLKRAWVLRAPNGRGRIDDEVLTSLGLQFPEKYVKVGEIRRFRKNELQQLWIPYKNDR